VCYFYSVKWHDNVNSIIKQPAYSLLKRLSPLYASPDTIYLLITKRVTCKISSICNRSMQDTNNCFPLRSKSVCVCKSAHASVINYVWSIHIWNAHNIYVVWLIGETLARCLRMQIASIFKTCIQGIIASRVANRHNIQIRSMTCQLYKVDFVHLKCKLWPFKAVA
jgi:hypothetical protein